MKKYIIIDNYGSIDSKKQIDKYLNDGYIIYKEYKFDRYYQLILKHERTAKLDNITKDE